MNHDAAQAPGVVMMDAMIARAKAACARIRSVLAATPPTRRVTLHRRQRQLRIMEDTLARLIMDRDATWRGPGKPALERETGSINER